MKKLFCIISFIALSFASASFAQDVAVVYDAKMENGGGLGIAGGAAGAKGLADMIVEKLNDEKLNAEIVDADGLVEYMEANQNGIFILTQGNTPDTIIPEQRRRRPYLFMAEGWWYRRIYRRLSFILLLGF